MRVVENNGGYSDMHRFTMRMMFKKPDMTLNEFLQGFNEFCVSHKIAEAHYSRFLSENGLDALAYEINDELGKCGCSLRIKKYLMKEEHNKVYWVLANTLDSEVSRNATSLKPWQITFVRKLVEDFAVNNKEDSTLYYATTKLMKLVNGFKQTVTHTELVELINQLCNEKWLLEHSKINGRYTLGVRSLVELQTYMDDIRASNDASTESLFQGA